MQCESDEVDANRLHDINNAFLNQLMQGIAINDKYIDKYKGYVNVNPIL
jgi:hypothetical protein